MGKVKSYKMFLETYSEDLQEVLSNEENKYIIMKGEEIIAGFEYLEDAFTHLSELIEGEGTIGEEQKYEFDDYLSEIINVEDDDNVPQDEIDQLLKDVLDKFDIIEPYKIMNRLELEETPVDDSIESDDFDISDELEEDEELETFLGESTDPFLIVGDLGGEIKEIDSFSSHEEADSYIDEYRKVYSEYNDVKIIHREQLTESSLIFTPDNESNCSCDENCKCVENGGCDCNENCNCEYCSPMRNESKIQSFSQYLRISDLRDI
jgi:hypothetical protein